jgi:hypothetical protein
VPIGLGLGFPQEGLSYFLRQGKFAAKDAA